MESSRVVCDARNDSTSSRAQAAASQNVQSDSRLDDGFLLVSTAKLDLRSLQAEQQLPREHSLGDKLLTRPRRHGQLHAESIFVHIP